MKKDKTCTIRINGTVKEILEAKGFTAQKIIDLFIGQNVEIKQIVRIKKDKK